MSVTLCERFNGTSQHCCDEIRREMANIQMPEIEYFIYISYEIAITTHTRTHRHIYPHSDAND